MVMNIAILLQMETIRKGHQDNPVLVLFAAWEFSTEFEKYKYFGIFFFLRFSLHK